MVSTDKLVVLLNRAEIAMKLLNFPADLLFDYDGTKFSFYSKSHKGHLFLHLGFMDKNYPFGSDTLMGEWLKYNMPAWIPYYDEGEIMGWKKRIS